VLLQGGGGGLRCHVEKNVRGGGRKTQSGAVLSPCVQLAAAHPEHCL